MTLEVEGLETAYGSSQVLFGISLAVRAGEVATLLGRNGMGKSTTVRSIMGMVKCRAGTIQFDAKPLHGLPSYRVAQSGLGLVPEGRQVFPNLTVRENLVATAAKRSAGAEPWTLERVYALFPQLAGRERNLGSQLSGGEQQMLAIARTLMGNPSCILLDEPSEGLAPLIVEQMVAAVRELRSSGVSVLLSEQNWRFAAAVADRAYIIEKGRIRYAGTMAELAADEAARYLAV